MVVSMQKLKAMGYQAKVTGIMFHCHDIDAEGNIMLSYTGKKEGIDSLIYIDVYSDSYVDMFYKKDGRRVSLFSDYVDPEDIELEV